MLKEMVTIGNDDDDNTGWLWIGQIDCHLMGSSSSLLIPIGKQSVGGRDVPLNYSVPLIRIDLLQILRHKKEAYGSIEMMCCHIKRPEERRINGIGIDDEIPYQMAGTWYSNRWDFSSRKLEDSFQPVPVHNIPVWIFYFKCYLGRKKKIGARGRNKDAAENLSWCGSNSKSTWERD